MVCKSVSLLEGSHKELHGREEENTLPFWWQFTDICTLNHNIYTVLNLCTACCSILLQHTVLHVNTMIILCTNKQPLYKLLYSLWSLIYCCYWKFNPTSSSSSKPKCLTARPVARVGGIVAHSSVSLGACLSSLVESSGDCRGWSLDWDCGEGTYQLCSGPSAPADEKTSAQVPERKPDSNYESDWVW